MNMLDEWQTTLLGSLGTFKNGVNYGKNSSGHDVRLINVKDIFSDIPRLNFDNLDVQPIGDDRTFSRYGVAKDDLFFVRSSVKRDGIGLVSRAASANNNAAHCGFVIRLRLTRPDIDPIFLAYLLRSPYYRACLLNLSGGAAITNISQENLGMLEIKLPPFPIQRKIAAVLSSYDDLIENNTRRIKILEDMAQMLYREWFVHFRFPGHEQSKMVETALGLIPKGWSIQEIGQVVETLGGGTPASGNADYWGGDVIWYSPTDLTKAGSMFVSDSAKYITKEGLQKSSARLFPAYSVMMTSRATIGVVAINSLPACTNQGFITCIPSEDVSAYQLYFWMLENKEKILSMASGATFKEINKGTFRRLPIPVADHATSEDFSAVMVPIGGHIENLLRKNVNLRQTRDFLLPKLISGEVNVADLDIAKPDAI